MKLLVDMNLSPRWVDLLSGAGIQAVLQVLAALRQMENDLRDGALLTVDPQRTRLRLLPLMK